MKDLLKFEFRKLLKQRSFYVCLIIAVAGVFLAALLEKLSTKIFEVEIDGESILPELSFNAFFLSAARAGNFSILAAVFIGIVANEDFERRTIKNVYAKGYSRTQVYFSKLIYCVTCTTIIFFACACSAALFGAIFIGTTDFEIKVIWLMLSQYVAALAEITFYFLLASMFKRIAPTIAIGIVGTGIISLVLGLISLALNINGFSLPEYWFSTFLSSLSELNVKTERIVTCLIASAAYIAAFTGLGLLCNRKNEV